MSPKASLHSPTVRFERANGECHRAPRGGGALHPAYQASSATTACSATGSSPPRGSRRACAASATARPQAAGASELLAITRPTSSVVAPSTRSERTRRSMDTVASEASIFAIRDWLDLNCFARPSCVSRKESRRSLMPLASASLISIRAASSPVRPRNSLAVPSFHPALSSLAVAAPARRCAPHTAAPASRSTGPSSAKRLRVNNARLGAALQTSNSKASPSAAPPVGTCLPDPHRPLPAPSHPHRSAVPHHGRTRNGTTRLPHSAPSILQLTSAGGAQRNSTKIKLRHRSTGLSMRLIKTIGKQISNWKQ